MSTTLKKLLISTTIMMSLATGAWAETIWNRGAKADAQTLDPHKSETVEESNIIRDLFTGLVEPDAEANPIPGMAESWTVSDDGKTYTFKMRKDAVWSDGTPVTAQDFAYSWHRLLDPETGSQYSSMAYPILNAEEINTKKGDPNSLGVKVVDDQTLQVTLKAPTPYFLETLTHQAMYPVNKANVEKFKSDFVKPGNLVSNGAFTLSENVPNDHVKLVKNPKFYDAASVKLDAVNYIPTESSATGVKRYAAGEMDSLNELPMDQLAELRKTYGDQVRITPQLGTYYYVFKTTKAPFNDPKLRVAISMIIDREQLAEQAWHGSMLPGYSMVPPGIKGYSPSMMSFANMPQLDREDAAKKMLAELGISPDKPLKMELRYNTSENHMNTAVAIQEMLKPFGIELSLLNVDGKSHYSYLGERGDYDMARAAWVADYKDPATFLTLLKTGDGNNYGDYSNKAYDALLDKASVEEDPAARMKLLEEAETIVVTEQPDMPLLYYANHNMVSPKIHGFVDNVMDTHPSRFITKD